MDVLLPPAEKSGYTNGVSPSKKAVLLTFWNVMQVCKALFGV